MDRQQIIDQIRADMEYIVETVREGDTVDCHARAIQLVDTILPQDKAPCETCFMWRSFSDKQQSKAKAGEKQCWFFCSDYYEWLDRLNQRDADQEELERVVREIFSKMKKKYIPSQSSAYEGEVVVVMKESDYDLLISKYLKEEQHG